MSEKESYQIGALVWGKMKGFPPWPGQVVEPPPELKRPASKKSMQCIYFFGSKNFAWLEETSLKDYESNKDTLGKACKTAAFREAVEAIENFITNNDEGVPVNGTKEPSEDLFDQLKNSTVEAPKPKKKKKPSSTPSAPVAEKDISDTTSSVEENGPSVKKQKFSDDYATQILANHTGTPRKYQSLLDRPSTLLQPELQPIDVTSVSETLKEKNISPSKLKFGFLGLGNMGCGILKNLLNSGHSVTIWNRTPDKCTEFEKAGAQVGMTPSDVIQASDITYSCVANPQSAKEMVFGNCGVLSEMGPSKSYVEMTGIDAETSQDIAEAISGKGGRYLEAQMQGSKVEAEEGTLVILAAGDKSLFDDCQSCFIAMSKNSFYLGEVGNASKMNLVLQLMQGITLAGLSEGMALADRAGLQQKDVLEILGLTSLACPALLHKGNYMIMGTFNPELALEHLQKDMKLSITLGDQVEQPLPLTAAANEVFKHAKRLGYGKHDASAIYIRARF